MGRLNAEGHPFREAPSGEREKLTPSPIDPVSDFRLRFPGAFSDPPMQAGLDAFDGWVESLRAALVRS